jgi:hypothetical protein
MYKIEDKEFETLTQAIEFATQYGKFVTITGGEFEIVGKFGVDSIKDGVCPGGIEYTWKKRRI